MLNKKGDMTTPQLVGLAIGGIILVLVILALTTNFNVFSSFTSLWSGTTTVQSKIDACNMAASGQGNYVSYCDDFGSKIKVDTKLIYVNCQYEGIAQSISAQLDCSGRSVDPAKKCGELIAKKYSDKTKKSACEKEFGNVYANNVSCKDVCVGTTA